MNIIFKIAIFGFMLYFATNITLMLLPDYANTCFPQNDVIVNQFNESMGGVINPQNAAQDLTSAFVRLIDSINVGVIGKFINGLNSFLFGTLDFSRCFFGYASLSAADRVQYDYVIGLLKLLFGMAYIFGAIYLWTGRVINR